MKLTEKKLLHFFQMTDQKAVGGAAVQIVQTDIVIIRKNQQGLMGNLADAIFVVAVSLSAHIEQMGDVFAGKSVFQS